MSSEQTAAECGSAVGGGYRQEQYFVLELIQYTAVYVYVLLLYSSSIAFFWASVTHAMMQQWCRSVGDLLRITQQQVVAG